MMAAIDAVSTDKPAYAPGEMVTVTVRYTADSPASVPAPDTVTAALTDAAGALLASGEGEFAVETPGSPDVVTVSDTGGRSWAKVSDDGTTAVFTATA